MSPGMGRFITPDRMTGKPSDPASWNKYAYASGDPVNRYDPSGAEDGEVPQSYCDYDPFSPLCSTADRGGPGQQKTTFFWDRANLIHAGGMLLARTSISNKCQGAMNALGVDFDTLAAEASIVDIQNGLNDQDSIASAYGDPAVGAAAQAAYDEQYGAYLQAHGLDHLTIGGYFAATGNTTAWTPSGGLVVFINPKLLDATSLAQDEGLMLHEMLHEVYGLDDTDILRALAAYDPRAGINPAGPSHQISDWMTANCVNGRGNN
jgi:hypothetical protein